MKTSTTKRLFTLKESAQYLGRSPCSVRSLAWAGELPTVRSHGVGTKIFFDIVDLDKWVESNKTMEGA